MQHSEDIRFKIIFYIILWSIWLGLPFVTNIGNERYQDYHLAMLPVTLTNIPLFLLNSEWLIPRIFRTKGIVAYLVHLLSLVLLFTIIQLILKETIVPAKFIRHHWDLFWAIVPVLFVTGISTGYGFIYYQLKQDKETEEAKQEQLKSELAFLRSQISPHFIFNILNSIVYLIRSKSELAEKVTIRLSELMRYMLYQSGDAQVPLDKEVEYLKNYIELQRIRFEEDVEIKFAIEGQINYQLIEPMLLIPFVENAFKHGVGLIETPVIEIHLTATSDVIDFMVKNRITLETAALRDPDSGIGLRNVKRRLELLYPHSHELMINSDEHWFEVRMHLSLTHKSIADYQTPQV